MVKYRHVPLFNLVFRNYILQYIKLSDHYELRYWEVTTCYLIFFNSLCLKVLLNILIDCFISYGFEILHISIYSHVIVIFSEIIKITILRI